jgi:calcium/calmodulin-dependent protein kinase I
VSKFSDSYKEFGNLERDGKIEMWTYTGTVAFSAPELLSGGQYKLFNIYDLYKASKLICGVLDAFYSQCFQASCRLTQNT